MTDASISGTVSVVNDRSSPSLSAEELHELTINIRQLQEETRLLRIAIDELRDDVVWAARNCLQAGYLPACESRSATTAESDECEPSPATAAWPVRGSNDPLPVSDTINPSTTLLDTKPTAEVPAPAASSPSRSVLSAAKKGPLHTRLYFHEPLTVVARAIGYEEVTTEEWQRRLAVLNEQHDPVLIAAAVKDLIERTPDKRIRLKTRLHSIAVGLLGRPQAKAQSASPVSTGPADSAPSLAVPVPETTSRHNAIERFLEFLQSRGIPYTFVNAMFRRRYPEQQLSRLDVIFQEGTTNTLVTVQSRLSKKLRHEAASWLVALGPARVLRVWPYRLGEHVQWQEETVEPLEL